MEVDQRTKNRGGLGMRPDMIVVLKLPSLTLHPCSLIPRLLRSGMQTLKLCMQRDPGIFSHVSTHKGRKGVERP